MGFIARYTMPTAGLLSVPPQDKQCSICGFRGKLTFEHIPPRQCFNDKPLVLHTVWSFIRHSMTPDRFPGGLGRDSLCQSCNGWSAQKYGRSYASWVEIGLQYHEKGPIPSQIALPFTIQPLEVAKQMAAMVLATNTWSQTQGASLQSLRRLVLHPWLVGKPDDVAFYLYFLPSGTGRLSPMTGLVGTVGVRNVYAYAEVALPPFGFVALSGDHGGHLAASRLGMCNVTHFFECRPRALRTEWLNIPWLEPLGSSILDYRGLATDPLFMSELGGKRAAQSAQRRPGDRQATPNFR